MSWSCGSDDVRAQFALDPTVTFLNHGSFGATPRPVLAAQARLREEMEAEPVLFLARRLGPRLEAVRMEVATFVGADPEGLVLVPNATTGVNAVLRSLDWAPGDEVLCADQSYHAVLQTVRFMADRSGVRLVRARLPFPIHDPAEIVAAFAAAITPHTRLLLVDHIASATGLVMPVEALVALGHDRGIPVLVDGAHAPGHRPLDLTALGADFYTGNLHKWAYAPKGAALLYVAPRWRTRVHPVAISHAYGLDMRAEFDWTGTFDPTAWLAIPDGLAFWRAHPGLTDACHALVQVGRQVVAEALGVSLPHPDDRRFYGSMAVIPFPAGAAADAHALTARLYEAHRIEVPFTTFDERVWVRISANVYSRPEQYVRLAAVLGGGWR